MKPIDLASEIVTAKTNVIITMRYTITHHSIYAHAYVMRRDEMTAACGYNNDPGEQRRPGTMRMPAAHDVNGYANQKLIGFR